MAQDLDDQISWHTIRIGILICLFVIGVPLVIAGIVVINQFPEDDTG